jgi:hypothetical protein
MYFRRFSKLLFLFNLIWIINFLLSLPVFAKGIFSMNEPSLISDRPNPFFPESDPYRLIKNSFTIYIPSINKQQFDIVVAASDTISQALGISSGLRKKPIGTFRSKESVVTYTDSAYFVSRFGKITKPIMTKETHFLAINDSKIIIKTMFAFKPKSNANYIEVFDVFVFAKDADGWIFEGYEPASIEFPCLRQKVWVGEQVPCQVFER